MTERDQEQSLARSSKNALLGLAAMLLAFLIIGLALWLKDHQLFEKRSFFAKKCLWILEDSLKIPRSLEIISVTEFDAPLAAGHDKSAYIVYEASNAYGVQIRDAASCEGNDEDRVIRFASDGKYTDPLILKSQDISAHFRVAK